LEFPLREVQFEADKLRVTHKCHILLAILATLSSLAIAKKGQLGKKRERGEGVILRTGPPATQAWEA
jgi:hypothetical protein